MNGRFSRGRQALVGLLLAALIAPTALVRLGAAPPAGDTGDGGPSQAASQQRQRRQTVQRALDFLVTLENEGTLSDHRPRAVNALFLLAMLSAGKTPADEAYGPAMRRAAQWLIDNTGKRFLGGRDQPNATHALAGLALWALVGTAEDESRNLALYRKARQALAYSLQIQDKGTDPAYRGGWRPNERTDTNQRLLSAWFLMQMQSARLRGAAVPDAAIDRARAFIAASQKGPDASDADRGGYSIDAAGLPVRSATAAGLAMSTRFQGEAESIRMARRWLAAHPPRWYGPHFFTTHYFAMRGLSRSGDADTRDLDRSYMSRLTRLLHQQQRADGRIPFPPGHGGPVVAMGPGYSTAMAVLILNADRGYLPVDQVGR